MISRLLVAGAAGIALGGSLGFAAEPARPAPRLAAATGAFEKAVERADAAKKAGKLDEAAEQYRKALTLKPGWLEGHWALATLLYDTDRYAEALEHFRRVSGARPDDGMALALKGLCEAQLKNHDRALADLQKARRLGIGTAPLEAVVTYQTARILNRLGNSDAAFEVLRDFAIQSDDSPRVIEAFGLAVLRLPYLPEEIPAEKREMVVLAGRGGYHMARGRRTEAGRLAMEELVSRFPSEPNVHYARGLYLVPEDPEGAISEFRRELALSPSHHLSMLQIAFAEVRRGNAEVALPLAEKAAEFAPNVPASCLVLGRVLLELGQGERAVPELEKAARLAPENPTVHFTLARAYDRVGRKEDAARQRALFQETSKAARDRSTVITPWDDGAGAGESRQGGGS